MGHAKVPQVGMPKDAPDELRERWNSLSQEQKRWEAGQLIKALIQKERDAAAAAPPEPEPVAVPEDDTIIVIGNLSPPDLDVSRPSQQQTSLPKTAKRVAPRDPDQPVVSSDDLADIRDWAESLDGISAERIRNCIVYQLDYKKDKWYRDNLTVGYLRRTFKGVTGARKLHEDTPPGWVLPDPNPLCSTTMVTENGHEVEKREYRRPKNDEERAALRKLAVNSRGKWLPYFVQRLVDFRCQRCKGSGYHFVRTYPDSKRYGHMKHMVVCVCVSGIPSGDPIE